MDVGLIAAVDPEASARVHAATQRFHEDADTAAAGAVWRAELAAAQARDDLEVEAMCLLRMTSLHHQRGDFVDSRLALDRAAGVFRDLGPGATEEPLHRVWRGILSALDGDYEAAVGWLEAGVALGRDRPAPMPLLVEASVAPWIAFLDPDRVHREPTDLARRLAAAGLDRWVVKAERAEVTLLLARGEFAEASALGHAAVGRQPNRAEQARLLLTTAWGELWVGDHERAAVTFAAAAEAATDVDARFLRSMALFGRAEAEPSRAAALLLDAIRDAGPGPAWARLWASRPDVTVEVLGARRILVGGREVCFRSEAAAELLFCVILSGPGGIHASDLAALLWPDTTDPAKAAASVNRHTTKARRELGSEGWRLRRDGSTLWFEPANVSVDLLDHPGPPAPHTVVLPGWEDRPWVAELRRRRSERTRSSR